MPGHPSWRRESRYLIKTVQAPLLPMTEETCIPSDWDDTAFTGAPREKGDLPAVRLRPVTAPAS